MPVTINHGRACLVASEAPLTWRQVQLLGYQASREYPSWGFGHWLQFGGAAEVAEWLWEYWIDQAEDGAERPEEGACPWHGREAWRVEENPTSVPTTARPAEPSAAREPSAAGGYRCSLGHL